MCSPCCSPCALCLGLGKLCIPSAFAADLTYAVTGGNLYFDAQTGTITKSDKTITEADISAEIYGVPVTAIGGSAFSNKNELTRVTIPGSVTTIGDSAFQGCHRLTQIVISDSVTKVGQDALRGCFRLTSATLGRGMTSVPQSMFRGCTALKSITIPDNITSIGSEAFSESGLTSVTLPNSVTSIGNAAYEYCYRETHQRQDRRRYPMA